MSPSLSVFGNSNSAKGNENGDITTNTESVINASGTLTMNSGKDTNIDGSQVKGDKVVADIKGDLNIASKQDTDNYTENNKSTGLGLSTEKVGGKPLDPGTYGPINKATTTTNGTASSSKKKFDSTYASVTDQAGIFAGKEGFDIKVGKNTDLKGAVISSDATPDKNKISTDTLTFSDMENRAKYSASNTGVNYDSKKYSPLDPNYKNQDWTPALGVTASGDADSTTKSAISPGTIEIRSNPKQDISGLSRDTTNSLNALGKIFDKATVQEKQELANMFGEVAFNAIGDLGLKEDDRNKVALKSIVGGIMTQISGGSFTSGATSAGFNQLIINELANIKDPAMLQWASLIIGATVSKLTGGDALTGGSITLSDIRNNFLAHLVRFAAIAAYRVLAGTSAGRAILQKLEIYSEEAFVASEEVIPKAIAEYNALIGKGASNLGKFYQGNGTVIENPVIKITEYDAHALMRMGIRGVTEEMVENIVANPIVSLSQWGGQRLLFIGTEGAAVVESETGKVVTTWAVKDFGSDIWKILFDSVF